MNDKTDNTTPGRHVTRRGFLHTTAASAAAVAAGLGAGRAYAAGSDTLKVGLIGCGGRGTGAAGNCAAAADGVKITAMGDLFNDRLERSKRRLSRLGPGKFDVPADRCFVGFDAYKKVLASDVDMVILGTPPHFRPAQLAAAIQAGKHVFMEKPVAVDPAGIRIVLAAAEVATTKKLSIVAGTQRRHQDSYVETIRRIHDGAIGEIVAGQCYWNTGTLWLRKRQEGWSEMEYQIRNWLYYTWLSGDHICEQHVHNIDVINWAMRAHPTKAVGVGGRQVRTDKAYGNIYDHFAIEFEYENGARIFSMCRQYRGATHRVSERVVGTKGTADPKGVIEGASPYRHQGRSRDPYVQEHANLIASIRGGKYLNEGRQVAESTMTAILGRMAAYTGREISWDWAMQASKLDLTPPKYIFGPNPVPPVAMPGKTRLI